MFGWFRTNSRRRADEAARREAKADYREAVIDVRDARISDLERENAALKAALAAVQMQGWMHSAIVRRDQATAAQRAEADRVRNIGEEPTAVYATEQIRRTR